MPFDIRSIHEPMWLRDTKGDSDLRISYSRGMLRIEMKADMEDVQVVGEWATDEGDTFLYFVREIEQAFTAMRAAGVLPEEK